VSALKARDLGYHILIDRSGTIFQCLGFHVTTWHAGKALWKEQSPNRHHISVSLISWGELDLDMGVYKSWNDTVVPPHEVRSRDGSHWDKAPAMQEASLEQVLRWCVDSGIPPGNICGHDECAIPKGRKVDPGGVLCSSIDQIRESLEHYRKAKNMA
jgi:N-acetyl-anhydromuramyl-L-alanine amidase AmpD